MNKFYRSLCFGILSAVGSLATVSALETSYYTPASVLSTGKWVKVKVSEPGMQEISYDRLRELGFSDPSKVAVYGYSGVELGDYGFSTAFPDDLPAVPVGRYDGKLVFHSEASEVLNAYKDNVQSKLPRYTVKLLRNLDCTYSAYYLTDSRPALEIETVKAEADASLPVLENAQGLMVRDFKEVQLGNTGAYLFSRTSLGEVPVQHFDLSMPDFQSDGDGPLVATAAGLNAGKPILQWTFPNEGIGIQTLPGNGGDPKYTNYYYDNNKFLRWPGIVKTDNDIYRMTVDASTSTALVGGGIDYIAAVYPRGTDVSVAPQTSLAFPKLAAGQQVALNGAAAGQRVWDVTYGSVPREFSLAEAGQEGKRVFVSDKDYEMTYRVKARHFIAFDPARKLNEVEVVGEIPNQNLHGAEVPDMLVVASENTYGQALRLAELHRRYTGYDVYVARFTDVCNEFSSGSRHPMAIRRMAKMFYDRDPEKFKAVLIFARGSHDNTGITSTELPEVFEASYIPMLECVDPSISGVTPKSYSTDAIYGMMRDDFVFDLGKSSGTFMRGLLDINVGRIPATNAGEATAYVDKLENYLSSPSREPVYNRALLLTDMGDKNGHIIQGESVRNIISSASPSTTVDCFHMALYDPAKDVERVRERLRQLLQRGLGYWTFMGHSAGPMIGNGGLWYNSLDRDVKVKYPPFVVYASCGTQAFDYLGSSIQVDMLLNPTGGMIAGVGPTRAVYMELNIYVSQMMAKAFYTMKEGAVFGDVYRAGRNELVTSDTIANGRFNATSIYINSISYNYAGDPMIPMNVPGLKAKVTAFNGSAPDGTAVSVEALAENTVSGVIAGQDGEVDETFDGTVTLMVYDAPHSENTEHNADKDNPTTELVLDEMLLQEVKFDVVKGHFSGKVRFSLPSYSGESNRISLFAVSADGSRRAVGRFDGVSILQTVNPEAAASAAAPVITSMYAVSSDFVDGDCLPASFTLYADVAPDEMGLIGNSDRMGGGVTVTLDDSRRLNGADSYFKVLPDGSGHLEFPVNELVDGPHYLTFRAMNSAGLTSERTIHFNVANIARAEMKLENTHARESAVIDIEHSLGDAPEGRLVVTASDGSTVFSAEKVTFPYTWNLKGTDGQELPDGNYSVGCYFKAGRRYGSANPATVVIGR